MKAFVGDGDAFELGGEAVSKLGGERKAFAEKGQEFGLFGPVLIREAELGVDPEEDGFELLAAFRAAGFGAGGEVCLEALHGGLQMLDGGLAPGDFAGVHLFADEDVLNGITGIDIKAGRGARLIGGGGVALGLQMEVAKFMGDDGFLVGAGGDEAFIQKDEEMFGLADAAVEKAEGLGAGKLGAEAGVSQVGFGEIGAGGAGGQLHLVWLQAKELHGGAGGRGDFLLPLLQAGRQSDQSQ